MICACADVVGTLRGEIKTLPPDNSLFISPGAADQDDDDDDTAMKSDDEGVSSQHLLLCWLLVCELRTLSPVFPASVYFKPD